MGNGGLNVVNTVETKVETRGNDYKAEGNERELRRLVRLFHKIRAGTES